MKDIHSYWAYLVLAILIFAVFNAINGLLKKRTFTDKDLRIGLFTLIVAHLQLLIGIILYIYQGRYSNFSETMKVSEARLLALEHPLMMVLALVLITMGWAKHKKKTEDVAKFKTFALFYGLALVFILSRIPWNNWF